MVLKTSQKPVGDFPLGWNTNSSAEIITFNDSPEKWLFMSQDGFFQPDFVKDMPDNFTLEYDIFTRYRSNNLLITIFLFTLVRILKVSLLKNISAMVFILIGEVAPNSQVTKYTKMAKL